MAVSLRRYGSVALRTPTSACTHGSSSSSASIDAASAGDTPASATDRPRARDSSRTSLR